MPPSRSSTWCSSTCRCAGSGAAGSGCARSTPRRRRRSTSTTRLGLYNCFGCDAGGDVITLRAGDRAPRLRRRRRVAGRHRPASRCATRPAARAGTASAASELVEAMEPAVEWYHERLLDGARRPRRPGTTCAAAASPATSPASSSSAGRPTTGTRSCRALRLPDDVLRDTGLAFLNRRNRLQDAFRARVHVPDLRRGRRAGGLRRADPAGQRPTRRSTRTRRRRAIYAKSKTLYGLNWAKADIVAADQVVVCEGYTDVIGFHRAGRAAGRRHVRHRAHRGARAAAEALRQPGRAGLRRRRRRPGRGRAVLRVGAEVRGRGQRGRAARAAPIPASWPSDDPGGAGRRGRRRRCRSSASGSTGCSRGRPLRIAGGPGPAGRARRWRWSTSTPTTTCASCTPARSPPHTGLPVADLVRVAPSGGRGRSTVDAAPDAPAARENAEFVALALLVQRWDEIAPWLVEALFADEAHLARVPRPGRRRRRRSTRPSSWPIPRPASCSSGSAVADVDADPDGRGAQPHRRGRATRAGRLRRDSRPGRDADAGDREAARRAARRPGSRAGGGRAVANVAAIDARRSASDGPRAIRSALR